MKNVNFPIHPNELTFGKDINDELRNIDENFKELSAEGVFEKVTPTLLQLPTATPVNAVAASKVLTVGGVPTEGDTITCGGKIYKARRTALGAGVKATKTLLLNSQPLEGDTVTIGGKIYKFRVDSLGAGVAASAILTNNTTAPSDGDTITIGTTVYRFKNAPAQANDIAISTATVSTLRLFKAISGTGIIGSDYFAGTAVPNIAVTAVHTSTFVITITANSVGFAGNLFAKAASSTVYDWDGAGAVFTGGIDAQAANDVYRGGGTSACIDNLVIAINTGASAGAVGTGTVAHTLVDATKVDTQNIRATAKLIGFSGNVIALAESLDDVASVWSGGATFLTGGIDAEAANDIYCTSAETFIDNLSGAIRDDGLPGTDYGTLTEVNSFVTAAKVTAATMSCTNLIKGVIGNDTVIAKSGTNFTWAGSAVKLSGGIDGTVSIGNEIIFDTDAIYISVGANTIADSNWKKAALSSL